MADSEKFLIDFSVPENLSDLAKFIGTSEDFLKFAIVHHVNHFTQHFIPKRNTRNPDGFRIVWEPHSYIAGIYKSFNRRFGLYARYVQPRYPHPSAYGYVRGRSTLDNAKGYCTAQQILHADIENFFPSISKDRVLKLFLDFRVKPEVAKILADLVTINNALPLGLHSSPLLADIICLDLDDGLNRLTEKYKCKYTRYADDISISGNQGVPSKDEVKEILEKHGFSLSERKFRVTKPGQAHYVTGLSVSDVLPRAPRSLKKRLRQELYYCKKYGIEDHIATIDHTDQFIQKGINRIDGMVRYIANIEQDALANLRTEWDALLNEQGLTVSYDSMINQPCKHFVFYIDETEIPYADKQLLALAFVKTEDHREMEVTTLQVLNEYLVDPFSGGRKKSLEKRKLHYTDANYDLRTKYVDKIAVFPFKAYLAYKSLTQPEEYESTYLSMLEKILPHRLMTCDSSVVYIFFEENPRVRRAEIEKTVNKLHQTLRMSKNRSPLEVRVHIGKKAHHPCFSIPDFLLGIFARYACGNSGEKDHLFFEKLRDQYRIIFDADKGIVFSRKRPFLPWGTSNVFIKAS